MSQRLDDIYLLSRYRKLWCHR